MKLAKCYIWNAALCGAETQTLRTVDQKCLESFEMWCCRRMGKISWTDRVRNGRSITKKQNGEEHLTNNKKKEG